MIQISAEINAPVERVWNAYTDPTHVVNWNFAHESWHCPAASAELKTGGKFVYRMEARDGSFGFDFGGVYRNVQVNRALAYTLEDARKVQIAFEAIKESTTKVHIGFEPETQNTLALQEQGWQAILNQFKHYVESL